MERPALIITIVPPIAIAFIMYQVGGPPWDAMRIFGLVLTVFGVLFLTIARFQLGNAFSITPQARMLVTRGIYSRVRHPLKHPGHVRFTLCMPDGLQQPTISKSQKSLYRAARKAEWGDAWPLETFEEEQPQA